MTNGNLRDGAYHNTTRQEVDQFYTYMWKWQCAFTRWTPSNQYLHEHLHTIDYRSDKITLSRFGFIGWDQKCYWGIFGVMWVKPLPVWQELNHVERVYNSGLHGSYDYKDRTTAIADLPAYNKPKV